MNHRTPTFDYNGFKAVLEHHDLLNDERCEKLIERLYTDATDFEQVAKTMFNKAESVIRHASNLQNEISEALNRGSLDFVVSAAAGLGELQMQHQCLVKNILRDIADLAEHLTDPETFIDDMKLVVFNR